MHKLPNTRVLAAPELCYGADNNRRENGNGRLKPTDGVWDMWLVNSVYYKGSVT